MRVLSYMVEAHIIRKTGNDIEFLLLKRAESEIYPKIWQMVTGSIAQDEKTYVTAYREIIEETGIKPDKLWIVPYVNSFYSWKRNHICMVPVFVALVGKTEAVKISREHSEYKWVNKEKANELLAWPGQRNSVELIHRYFTGESGNLHFEEITISNINLKQIQK